MDGVLGNSQLGDFELGQFLAGGAEDESGGNSLMASSMGIIQTIGFSGSMDTSIGLFE